MSIKCTGHMTEEVQIPREKDEPNQKASMPSHATLFLLTLPPNAPAPLSSGLRVSGFFSNLHLHAGSFPMVLPSTPANSYWLLKNPFKYPTSGGHA
jgi:hypothetical protein